MLTQVITILLIVLWVLILAATVVIGLIDIVFRFMRKEGRIDSRNKNYAEKEM